MISGIQRALRAEIVPKYENQINTIVAIMSIIMAISAVFGNLSQGIWPWIALVTAFFGTLSILDKIKTRTSLLGSIVVLILFVLFVSAAQFLSLGGS